MSRLARFRRCAIVRIASLALLPAGFAAHAGELTIPHSFSAGTPAQAAQVNANFAATRTAVNDNDTRIAALETHLAALQSQVAALQSQVAAIEVSAVMALEPYVSLVDVPDPNDAGVSYATIRLTGVNLQIMNGISPSATTPNGLGNLIIGHNTLHTGRTACSTAAPGPSTIAAARTVSSSVKGIVTAPSMAWLLAKPTP